MEYGINKNITPAEELEILRNRVKELEAVNPNSEKKEIIKEVLAKHLEETPSPILPPQEGSPKIQESVNEDGVEIIVDEHGVDMHKFLSLIHEKGVWYALDLARRTSPHLLDDFHSVTIQYLQSNHGF